MNTTLPYWTVRSALAATMIAGVLVSAQAAPIYDTSAQGALSATRSVGIGLVIGGGNATTASLTWNISYNAGSSLWHYSYSFSENSQQGISHFLLDLSDNCTATARCILNLNDSSSVTNLVYGTFTSANGNPNFPGSIVGVKFDSLNSGSPYSFEFDSARAPVFGDFYAKGGNGGSNGFAVYNAGAVNHDSEFEIDFIARPDTVIGGPGGVGDPVPEPASILMLGLGLAGLSFAKRRRG